MLRGHEITRSWGMNPRRGRVSGAARCYDRRLSFCIVYVQRTDGLQHTPWLCNTMSSHIFVNNYCFYCQLHTTRDFSLPSTTYCLLCERFSSALQAYRRRELTTRVIAYGLWCVQRKRVHTSIFLFYIFLQPYRTWLGMHSNLWLQLQLVSCISFCRAEIFCNTRCSCRLVYPASVHCIPSLCTICTLLVFSKYFLKILLRTVTLSTFCCKFRQIAIANVLLICPLVCYVIRCSNLLPLLH